MIGVALGAFHQLMIDEGVIGRGHGPGSHNDAIKGLIHRKGDYEVAFEVVLRRKREHKLPGGLLEENGGFAQQ